MKKLLAIAFGLVFLISLAVTAYAGPYVPITNPVQPIAGPPIPPPDRVPGKEYVDSPNKDATGALSPGQSIAWDGSGGVMNTFNYGTDEVDALANSGDALYRPAVNNQSAIIFSVCGDNLPALGAAPVYSESIIGVKNIAIWATVPQVDQHGVRDLGGLEVWGPEGFDDANRYSLLGDPNGVSILNYAAGTPFVTTAQIAGALQGMGINISPSDVDLDALMVNENGDGEWNDSDSIMFSLMPIPAAGIVGDEVWVWDNGKSIGYLDHGGHLWNSNWLGYNVDALEAVSTPEPGTLLLLGSGLAGVFAFGRKRLFRKS